MRTRRKPNCSVHLITITIIILLFILTTTTVHSRPFVLILSQDDLNDNTPVDATTSDDPSSVNDWDEFGDSNGSTEPDESNSTDPASWRVIFEPDDVNSGTNPRLDEYYSIVRKLIDAVSVSDGGELEDVVLEIESVAETGNCYAQSLLGFVYGVGMGRARNEAKAVMYHYFAAEGGDVQSKMARAYMYARQEVAS